MCSPETHTSPEGQVRGKPPAYLHTNSFAIISCISSGELRGRSLSIHSHHACAPRVAGTTQLQLVPFWQSCKKALITRVIRQQREKDIGEAGGSTLQSKSPPSLTGMPISVAAAAVQVWTLLLPCSSCADKKAHRLAACQTLHKKPSNS